MLEEVGVLGLVLTVHCGLMVHLFRFATVALVLLVVSYPRRVN